MKLITKAKRFAMARHAGQMYNGGQFVTHPFETADILLSLKHLAKDENLICAAYLHDTIEDGGATYEELKREFNEDIASLVREVSKDGYNSFPYLKTQRGAILKFADRLDNISHMDNWTEEKRTRYIFEKSKFWK